MRCLCVDAQLVQKLASSGDSARRISCMALHPMFRMLCDCYMIQPVLSYSMMMYEHDARCPCAAAELKQELVDSAQRQVHLTRGSPLETRRRRLVAWLQRRGHSWDTISAILKELAF